MRVRVGRRARAPSMGRRVGAPLLAFLNSTRTRARTISPIPQSLRSWPGFVPSVACQRPRPPEWPVSLRVRATYVVVGWRIVPASSSRRCYGVAFSRRAGIATDRHERPIGFDRHRVTERTQSRTAVQTDAVQRPPAHVAPAHAMARRCLPRLLSGDGTGRLAIGTVARQSFRSVAHVDAPSRLKRIAHRHTRHFASPRTPYATYPGQRFDDAKRSVGA
jgi:hypothetical protein